jgi:hypothetical protein
MSKDFKKWNEIYDYFFEKCISGNKNGYATLRANLYCVLIEFDNKEQNYLSVAKILQKLGTKNHKNVSRAIKDLIEARFIDKKNNILKG